MTDPSDTLRFRARLALRATGLALALLAAPAHPLAACSQGVPWGYLLPRNVPFIGTALGDTLLAGPGAMRPVFAIGHTGRGQPREIFGQRVRVDRMGSRARSAFPVGTTHVVLVPWDFDAGCRTVPWGRSARWLDEGTAGLFSAELRDREHWVDGLPTFDVLTTAFQPYQHVLGTSARRLTLPQASAARLTADELLRFYDDLPPHRSVPDSVAALAELRRLSADSALSTKYPVIEFRRAARFEFGFARQRAIRVPLAGTFRLSLARIGGSTVTALLRVDDGVSSAETGEETPDTALAPPLPRGYFVQATVALRLEDLDPDCLMEPRNRLGYVDLDWHGPTPSDGNGNWRGGFEPRIFESLMTADSLAAFRARVIAGRRTKVDSLNAIGARFQRWVPNRPLHIEQRPGEAMRIFGEITIEHLGTFRVTGERISPEVLVCDR